MGLSGLSEIVEKQKRMFKETDILCSEHEVHYVQFQERTPFCPICASERTTETEKEMLEKETKKAYNRNKQWLKRNSVLTNKNMLNMTFDNFEEVDEETERNKEMALDVSREIYKGSNSNRLIAGKFGTGKTHLAMAILNKLNEHQNKKLVFVSFDELMRRIKANFNNPESPYREDVVVQMMTDADVLVVDDLGAEVGSVDRKSQASDYNIRVLNAVLSGRADKSTIFTTNLTMKDLRNMYDGRIMSRLLRGVKQEELIIFTETTDKRTNIEF